MKKINLKISQPLLSKIKMVDCGNVNELESLEQLIRDLSSLPHSITIVVGGTNEMDGAVIKGCDRGVSWLKVDS